MVHTVLLLRHAEVTSHRGDVPITDPGRAQALRIGRLIATSAGAGPVRVGCGATLRTRDTAAALAAGLSQGGARVVGPSEVFALRNPDLYLAGERVDMVSSVDDFAAQVPGLDAEAVAGEDFFTGFVAARDRIGWWLAHPQPPGDDAHAVASRLTAYLRSLAILPGGLLVAATHSPVLRACWRMWLGHDPGEPPYVGGLECTITTTGVTARPWTADEH